MEYLQKEEALVKRDEKGEIIPIEVVLDLLKGKPKVKLTPLLKGEIQKLMAITDEENRMKLEDEILISHCIEPSYTAEEFSDIKPEIYGALKIAILSLSTGQNQETIKDESVKQVLDAETLKKNN